jgi:hypothetical protein
LSFLGSTGQKAKRMALSSLDSFSDGRYNVIRDSHGGHEGGTHCCSQAEKLNSLQPRLVLNTLAYRVLGLLHAPSHGLIPNFSIQNVLAWVFLLHAMPVYPSLVIPHIRRL